MRRSVRKTEHQEDVVNNKNTVNNRTMRMGVVGLCLGVALSVTVAFSAQPPAVEWMRTFAGLGEAAGFSLQQTSDGGFVAAGRNVSSCWPSCHLPAQDLILLATPSGRRPLRVRVPS